VRAVALGAAAASATIGIAYYLRRRIGSRSQSRERCGVPLTFATCNEHFLTSAEGVDYRLLVSLPLSYRHASSRGSRFPVLYVLDGEPYLFPLLTTAARTGHFFARSYWYPDIIVVGICSDLCSTCTRDGVLDVKDYWDSLRPTRARDYLPTRAESPWGAPGADSLLEVSGHASTFAVFLTERVVPFVEATYRSVPGQRALIGKSFGGSGVAHVMLEAGPAFRYYLLGSPSLGWDEGAFFRLEEASAATRPPLEADVFCCCGEKEGTDGVRNLKATLSERRGCPGSVTVDIVAGETHGSVSYPFAHRALAWLAARLEQERDS